MRSGNGYPLTQKSQFGQNKVLKNVMRTDKNWPVFFVSHTQCPNTQNGIDIITNPSMSICVVWHQSCFQNILSDKSLFLVRFCVRLSCKESKKMFTFANIPNRSGWYVGILSILNTRNGYLGIFLCRPKFLILCNSFFQ